MTSRYRAGLSLCALIALISSACSAPFAPNGSFDARGPDSNVRSGESASSVPDPTRTTASFYPLEIGNHWSYEMTVRAQEFLFGQPPSEPTVTWLGGRDEDLIGTEVREGREYVVQLETLREPDRTLRFRFFYRQDEDGLFRLGYTIQEPGPDLRAAAMDLRAGSPRRVDDRTPP